jgi:hypothetical protein
MMKLRKEDYERPEDGEYVAELTDVVEFASEQHPEWGTSLRFQFKILEEPFVNSVVSGLVSASWKPGNKLDKWLIGLGVDSTNIGDELKVEELKGRQARIYVEKDPKSEYVNVKLVKPLRATDSNRIAPTLGTITTGTPVQQGGTASNVAPIQAPKSSGFVKPTRQIPF